MAARRTLEFLPSIFQTDTNRKFLSATLDQLVTEPDFVRLNGYVGRTFAPTYRSSDSYILESNAQRQNYQLEPSLVIKDSSNNVDFYANYPDLINKISYYGGVTNNHDRLFSSEYYAYNNLVDPDKFINYSQYYWLPNGPQPILISSETVPAQKIFKFNKDHDDQCYRVVDLNGENPDLILSRGGNYRFQINQPGSKFWIQTEPGVAGVKRAAPNIGTREIYGVTNNGEDDGIVEFRAPLSDTQDVYLKMPMQSPVDYAIDTAFSSIDGALWESVVENFNGFDGMDVTPAAKTLIFLNSSNDAAQWQRANGSSVAPEHRRGVWRVRITRNIDNKPVINLDYLRDIPVNHRVYSRTGRTNANKEFYRNSANQLLPVPALTAQLDILYYQDESNPNFTGRIRLVNGSTDNIYVDTAIIGKKNYTSAAGVDFSNGMIVKFDSNVEPKKYANNTYVVEGVGRSIRLINFDYLRFPEPDLTVDSVPYDSETFDSVKFDELYLGPSEPQYITINRGSLDLNAWSRQNRWFHIDVITKSAELNNTAAALSKARRAIRPILEFEPDIQLLNNGSIGKRPVDHIDTVVTDAFNQVQHSNSLYINGHLFKKNQRVLFPNDKDPLVRSQVYRVEYRIQDESSFQSYYDGVGTGTITVSPLELNYIATVVPEEQVTGPPTPGYNYKWTVTGRNDLLTASRITGFDVVRELVGTVTDIQSIGLGQYDIYFNTIEEIDQWNIESIVIESTVGIATLEGTDTEFTSQLKIGTVIFNSAGSILGTIDGIQSDTLASLETNSTLALSDASFQFKHPRIQLIISEDSDDALEPNDTLVAIDGMNRGRSYYYDGVQWLVSQNKIKSTQTPLFDVFDNSGTSFTKYTSSLFAGTKIFSYKVGSGSNDPALGFPLSYTANSTIADITFNNDFNLDTFKYQLAGKFIEKRTDSGWLKQNIGRYTSVKRNTWVTVNEPSKQYQIISRTYTGRTNHFEIDALPESVIKVPTIKVFVNNKKILSSQFIVGKVGSKNTVKINARLLSVGDRIDILIYSKTVSSLGFYQIPVNLDLNSKNSPLTTVTLGQLRTNLTVVSQNVVDLVGEIPGTSNLRDMPIKGYGGNIIQNSAPLLYSGLFLIHEQANFVNALEYARKEYAKFKNKFLELSMTLPNLDFNNARAGVDKILENINLVKTQVFPWYYSDMVPYGSANIIRYTVLDEPLRQYKITEIFNDRKPQNRAVLVYHNNIQLIKGRDFTFDQDKPSIRLADHIVTVIDDLIEIREYQNTEGNFIPETPTKLGLYPKFLPELITDDTYRTPIEIIQGHDGSRTPAFGDHRDWFLLELENRIYNNIKLDPDRTVMDVRSVTPGRFRSSDYSRTEFTNIISRSFMRWAGANKIDYITNQFFVGNDQFTYNYRKSKDSIFGENLPGHWRGIYQYFYDTDRPHTHPWEMLGFTMQPQWWEQQYGPAPYTDGNTILWEDLEKGLIKHGPRAGIDSRYARPGLLKIIPVNSQGELLSPLAKISVQFSSQTTNESWEIGDQAPAESAWRNSSDYPFALQLAAALMKPAQYFGTLIDTHYYYKDLQSGQYIDGESGHRITAATIRINGESVNNSVTKTSGYLNYIVDYLTSLGINGSQRVRSLLNNLQVQLSYKLAGYSDKKYLTVLAEQFSPTSTNNSIIIPDDSYTIHLNKSVPVERIAYSAVIVQRTSTGFAISGYNINNPFFTIVPSETAGDKYTVSVENLTAIIYKEYKKLKLTIPYGTEFKTRQQLVDFLISYQRYLFVQGFIFDEYNEDLAKQQDWILSVQEFLTWSLQGWGAGNSLVLSPVKNTLKVLTTNAMVDAITNDSIGSKILDPNFNIIKTTDITTLRDSNIFKVTSLSNATFSFAELNLIQFEHVLIFDNSTIFNDIIYQPESGSRQYRLKLVGNKTAGWDGSINPSGFVYNSPKIDSWQSGRDYKKGDLVVYKNQYYVATDVIDASVNFDITVWKQIDRSEIKTGLLPNFATTAGKFIDIYDVDSSTLDSQLLQASSGLIGFRARDYLTDLNINTASQVKFYQGFIKEKGTGRAITNLQNAEFNNLVNDISYNEEWAFRVGEYGATEVNGVVEIELDAQAGKNNPVGLSIIDNDESGVDGVISIKDRDLYARPFNNKPVKFLTRPYDSVLENDLQTAGYVNLDDADATVFDGNDYTELNNRLDEITRGYVVWVAKDTNRDWNIYRVSETNSEIQTLAYGLDNTGKLTTKEVHNFSANQIIVIKNFNNTFNGVYKIEAVTDSKEFTILMSDDQLSLLRNNSISGPGLIFRLDSVRFASPSLIGQYTPRHGWRDGDRVWVDRNETNQWTVFEKNSVWTATDSLDIKLGETRPEIAYGSSVRIDSRGQFVVVGAPGDQNGTGRIHIFDRVTDKELGVLPSAENLRGLGYSVDIAGFYTMAGAPNSFDTKGAVIIYKYAQDTFFTPVQILVNPVNAGLSYFGHSVSASADGNWLYVGSPGNNRVHYYKIKNFSTAVSNYTVEEARNGCRLPYTVTDPDSLAVYIRGRLLVPGVDYTYNSGSNKVFILLNDLPELATESGLFFETEDGTSIISGELGFGPPGTVTIMRRSYYQYLGTVSLGTGIDNFGYSVKTSSNGSLVIIGAPGTTDQSIPQAGRAYLFTNNRAVTPQVRLQQTFNNDNPVYRARFGTSVEMCSNNCSVYIGAPGYSDLDYRGGQVSRFVNTGGLFGEVRGTIANPTVTVGNSIFINGIEVEFTGTTLSSVIDNINSANIVGVTAANVDNKLVISSLRTVDFSRLQVFRGAGNALQDLGIIIFETAQLIRKPIDIEGENFGESLRVSRDALTLAVSSTRGTAQSFSIIDSKTTIFDGGATSMMDITAGTGAVYMHEFLANSLSTAEDQFGTFVFTEELNAPNLQLGDQFGSSVDFDNTGLYVGASFNDRLNNNSGSVYAYQNPTAKKGWGVVQQQGNRVEIHGINSIGLYNKVTKSKIANLDYIDPAKGKALGLVEENLNYKSSRDPAEYNAGTSITNSQTVDFHWGKQQLGQTWWNLDTVRFIDYEQSSLSYRLNNWASIFPGSDVAVYQWTESSVLPSEYVANGNPGMPLYADNSAYVQISYADPGTGIIKTKYYFWVRGIGTVDSAINRTLSVAAMEYALRSPKLQSIPYAALLDDRSIGLYNCEKFINSGECILKISYDNKLNSNNIHSEFQLVSEKDTVSTVPRRIIDKLVDSLSGIDQLGLRVPDAKLKPSQNLGLNIRPKQTLIIDRFLALKNVIQFVNGIFKTSVISNKLQNSRPFINAHFYESDPEPTNYTHRAANSKELSFVIKTPGDTILVASDDTKFGLWTLYEVLDNKELKLVRNQGYKTTDLWNFVDWYSADYSKDSVIDYTLQYLRDLQKITAPANSLIKINNARTGLFEIYRYINKDNFDLVAMENGTVQLDDRIWNTDINQVGYDNSGMDESPYDRDYSVEIRNIMQGLEKEILVDDLVTEYKSLIFVIINHILSEQQNVDWIFKTSFISVLHKIKELKHYPNFIRDNHNYYEDYINEVKPYRTKIRDYRVGYTGLDTALTSVSDFDLPGYWDKDLKRFRSPSTELATKDSALFALPQYRDFVNNFTSKVDSIIIANPGSNYSQPPQIEIVANNDNGSGAEAAALIDEITGSITKIYITNSGSGYRNTPFVIVNGDGINGRAYAQLANNKIRSIKTVMKFDRISYTTSVVQWQPNVNYSIGQTVSYQGRGYTVEVPGAFSRFVTGNFSLISDQNYASANDRIAATYLPGPKQIPRTVDTNGNIDLSRLIPGITYEANKVSDESSIYRDTNLPSPRVGQDISAPETIKIEGGSFYDRSKSYAPEELMPGTSLDSISITVNTTIDESQYIYKIYKNSAGQITYKAVDAEKTTTLSQDFNYNDTRIYLTDINAIYPPQPALKKPGMIYINGELIKFYRINREQGYIENPIRAVDDTAHANVHLAGSTVIDQSPFLTIPGTQIVQTEDFDFSKKQPILKPTFTVKTTDPDVAKDHIEVYRGINQLNSDEYALTLIPTVGGSKVEISLANAANFPDGWKLIVKYIEDKIWLNAGVGSVTNGTGLAGANTMPATFIKQFPHNLP